MTFQELAIRLNYNGPSGAKAYKAADAKLKRDLYSRGLRPVARRTEGHPRRQGGGGAGDGAEHNAAEDPIGAKRADGAVYLRGRFADPCS